MIPIFLGIGVNTLSGLISTYSNFFECKQSLPKPNLSPPLEHESLERFSRAGPRGRGREWATLGVHPLSWLLSNNRLEKVPVVSVPHTSSNRLLLSNQDKGCTPSVAHSLPLPLGPALLNLWTMYTWSGADIFVRKDR